MGQIDEYHSRIGPEFPDLALPTIELAPTKSKIQETMEECYVLCRCMHVSADTALRARPFLGHSSKHWCLQCPNVQRLTDISAVNEELAVCSREGI